MRAGAQSIKVLDDDKLGAITNGKPVKLTAELPATVHRDLTVYVEAVSALRLCTVLRDSVF